MQRRSQWQRRLGGGSAVLAATALAVWSINQCCSRKLRRPEMLRRHEVDFTQLPSCRLGKLNKMKVTATIHIHPYPTPVMDNITTGTEHVCYLLPPPTRFREDASQKPVYQEQILKYKRKYRREIIAAEISGGLPLSSNSTKEDLQRIIEYSSISTWTNQGSAAAKTCHKFG